MHWSVYSQVVRMRYVLYMSNVRLYEKDETAARRSYSSKVELLIVVVMLRTHVALFIREISGVAVKAVRSAVTAAPLAIAVIRSRNLS